FGCLLNDLKVPFGNTLPVLSCLVTHFKFLYGFLCLLIAEGVLQCGMFLMQIECLPVITEYFFYVGPGFVHVYELWLGQLGLCQLECTHEVLLCFTGISHFHIDT